MLYKNSKLRQTMTAHNLVADVSIPLRNLRLERSPLAIRVVRNAIEFRFAFRSLQTQEAVVMSTRLTVHLGALAQVACHYPATRTRSDCRPRSAVQLRHWSVTKDIQLGIDGVAAGVSATFVVGGSPLAKTVSAKEELFPSGCCTEEAPESRKFRIRRRRTPSEATGTGERGFLFADEIDGHHLLSVV